MRRACLFAAGMLIVSLLMAAAVHAQTTTATVFGRVLDTSGAVLPGATVTMTNEQTATTRSVLTDDRGEFTVTFLPVGTYRVAIEMVGFKRHQQSGLELAAGQRLERTYTLEIGEVTESVEVVTTAPLLNTTSAQDDVRIPELQLKELPLLRRDITALLNLGAGVTTGKGGLGTGVAINGMAPSGLSVTLDGVDASRDSELNSLVMYQDYAFIKGASVEAIQEVQVAKNVFSAEISNTMTGNVNFITRNGTNAFRGSLFQNYQSGGLNARHPLRATKPPLVFHQFGGSLGGPIKRDKLFFFGVYEGYRLTAQQVLTGNVPTQEFRNQAIAAVPAYKQFLDFYPLPTQPAAPGALSAPYVGTGGARNTENHAIVRIDYNVTPGGFLAVRYMRARPDQIAPALVAANAQAREGLTEAVTGTYIHGAASWTSETRVAYNRNDTDRRHGVYTLGVPSIFFSPASVGAGAELIFRSGSTTSIEEIVALTRGRHSLKAGGLFRALYSRRENVGLPRFNYNTIEDLFTNTPASVRFDPGTPLYELRRLEQGYFVQHDIRVNPRLLLNLGLRYDYYSVLREEDNRVYNRDGAFGPELPPEKWYNPDYLNFAPRLGFALKLDERGDTVLRGGYGVFTMPQTVFVMAYQVGQVPGVPFRITLSRNELLEYGLAYPATNEDAVAKVGGSTGTPGLETRAASDVNLRNPYSQQWTLGIQRRLSDSLAGEVSYVGNKVTKLYMPKYMNSVDRMTGLRPVGGFGEFYYLDNSNTSNYNALQASLRKRFSQSFAFNSSYTWASNLTYSAGDMLGGWLIQDNDRIYLERGPTDFDVRHRLTSDLVYELPLGRFGADTRGRELLLGGWQLAGIFVAQSGTPFNVYQSSSVSTRVDFVGSRMEDAYLRSGTQYLNPAAFALVPTVPASGAGERPGTLGRNALRGLAYWDLALAVSKNVQISERMRLQLRVDSFNALNHTFMSSLTTNPRSAAFGQFQNRTSPRVMQFNARLTF
jgi:hypothetical protein